MSLVPNQSPPSNHPRPVCTIITPIYNAAAFLTESLISITQTTAPLASLQLILYNDSSTDATPALLTTLLPHLPANTTLITGTDGPLGVGAARNRACRLADAPILLFHDADDVMRPSRIARTLSAFADPVVDIVGGTFDRVPSGSTPRYEKYHQQSLTTHLAHAFRDAPLAFPTVACRKHVWRTVPFREGHVPEDLHFLYDAMAKGYKLHKLPAPSLTGYRYHPAMTSLRLHRRSLLDVRVAALETLVLGTPPWSAGFSIWGCGRDGKDIYKRLSGPAQERLRAWGDVDPRKIGKLVRGCPVVHFSELKPPILCAVAMDRGGAFERNLASLRLTPGVDYVHVV